jgi:hypothetical protein
MRCVSCGVRSGFMCVVWKGDHLCGLVVVGVPGCSAGMCASRGVRTGFICVVWKGGGPPLWSCGQSSWLHNGDVLCFLWGANWVYMCYVAIFLTF